MAVTAATAPELPAISGSPRRCHCLLRRLLGRPPGEIGRARWLLLLRRRRRRLLRLPLLLRRLPLLLLLLLHRRVLLTAVCVELERPLRRGAADP